DTATRLMCVLYQAEDGIRERNVTGVQTCALPILRDVRNIWRQANGRTGTQSTRELPSKAVIENIIKQLSGALFPMRLGPSNLHRSEERRVGKDRDSERMRSSRRYRENEGATL